MVFLVIFITVNSEHLGPVEIIPYTGENIATIEKLHEMNPIVETYALSINTNLTNIASCGSAVLYKIALIKNKKEICLTKGCLTQLELIKQSVERAAYTLKAIKTTGHKRQKRSWLAAGDFLHDAFGVLTETDLQTIQETSSNIRQQQTKMIQQINQEKQYFVQTFEHLQEMASVINNISAVAENRTNLAADIAEKTDQNLETLAILKDAAMHFVESTSACIELLNTGKLTGRLLNLTRLDEIYADIQKKLLNGTKIALDTLLELSVQRRSNTKIIDNIMTTTFEIPIVIDETWELFHLKHGLVVEGHKIIMMHIEDQLIARSPYNWTTKIETTEGCFTTSAEHLACFIKAPITHTPSCAIQLIASNQANSSLCRDKIVAAKIQNDVIIRVEQDQVLVIPHTLTNVSVNCLQKWNFSVLIKRPSTIKVNEPCTVKINELMFMEAPTKTQTVEISTRQEIKLDVAFHAHINDAPPFPRISQASLVSMDQLGKQIKALNDEDVNTPFYHRMYRRSSKTQLAGVSVALVAIIIVAVYVYLKCSCCCCCC